MRGQRLTAVALSAGILIATCGCQQRPSSQGPGASSPVVTGERGDRDASRRGDAALLDQFGPAPLDAYQWTSQQRELIETAFRSGVERCMSRAGVAFELPDHPPVEPTNHWSGVLGLTDLEVARARGYAPEVPPTPPPTDVLNAAGQRHMERCTETAVQAVAPTRDDVDMEILPRLYELAVDEAREVPAVVSALETWQECMHDKGHAVESVVPIVLEPPLSGSDAVRMAVDDVTCKWDAGLPEIFVAALYDAERRLSEENFAALSAYQLANAERAEKAKELTEAG